MKIGRIARNIDIAISGTSLVVLVAMTVVMIVLRSVFTISFIGSDELSRYLLICVVFLALPSVTRNGEHIKMEEMAALLPKSWRRVLRLIIAIAGFFSFAVITISTVVNILGNLGTVTPSLLMPYTVFFAPTLIGFFLVTAEYLIIVVQYFTPGSRLSEAGRDDKKNDSTQGWTSGIHT